MNVFYFSRSTHIDHLKASFQSAESSGWAKILFSKWLLSRNYLFNFRATFSFAEKRTSALSENLTDWKSALTLREYLGDLRNFGVKINDVCINLPHKRVYIYKLLKYEK